MHKGKIVIIGYVLFYFIFLGFAVNAGVLPLKPGEERSSDSYYPEELAEDFSKMGGDPALEFSVRYSGSTLWQGTYGVVGSGDLAYCYQYFGLQVIDFSNPSSPEVIAELYHPDRATDMVLVDDFLYVVGYQDLLIFDISDPYAPFLAGTFNTEGLSSWGYPTPIGVEIVGDYAYLSGHMSYFIIDIANKSNPSLVNYFDPEGLAMNSVINNGFAYIASEFFLSIWNISDPMAPEYLGKLNCGEDVYDVEQAGNYLFVANRKEGLYVLFIGATGYPTVQTTWRDTTASYSEVELVGDYLYLQANNKVKILDVSYPGNPTHIADWPTPGYLTYMSFSGEDAFCSDWAKGIERFDISSPASPVLEAAYENPGMGYDLVISGNYGFMANGIRGLKVLDLSDSEHPAEVASYDTPGDARTIELAGNYIYLGDRGNGLVVFDVSDPVNPVYQDTHVIPADGYMVDMLIDVSYLFVTVGDSGLLVYDISNPQVPNLATTLETPDHCYRLAIQGDYIYMSSGDGGIRIVDISDPLAPIIVGSYNLDGYSTAIAVSGNYAYVNYGYWDQMAIFDVSDPQNPAFVGDYIGFDLARNIEVVGDYMYVAAYTDGLKIINISTPEAPVLAGQYNTAPGWSWDVDVVGDNVYVTCDNGFLSLKLGDCSGPNGTGAYDVADIVFLISYIFKGGTAPDPLDAGDVNCDGDINVGDAVHLIDFTFRGGAAPCGGCYQ